MKKLIIVAFASFFAAVTALGGTQTKTERIKVECIECNKSFWYMAKYAWDVRKHEWIPLFSFDRNLARSSVLINTGTGGLWNAIWYDVHIVPDHCQKCR